MTKISYSGYRFPPEIIQQAIWLYVRFTLSFRDVEDLLAERGIVVSYETVRRRVSVRVADRRGAGKQVQAISLTRARRPPHGRVEKGPGPGRPAHRPRYFFGGGAGGGAGGGTSSRRPPKMSCFQRSKRESAILTRCVFSGPISCAAITLPSGLATPSPLA